MNGAPPGLPLATPLDSAGAGFLPGMEEHATPTPLSDAQIARLPAHTAEHLYSSDPDRYALAASLFFCGGLTQRMICSIARISGHTLTSIILRECRSATAAKWREAMSGDLRAINTMAMAIARELLADPKAVRAAGLRGVAAIMRESRESLALLEGRTPTREDGPRKSDEQAAADYLNSLQRVHPQSIGAEKKSDGREVDTDDAGAVDASMAEVESDT